MAQDKIIGVRVDVERLTTFEAAAQVAGKKVSEWLRDLGIAALSLPPPNPDEVGVEIELPIILAKRLEMYVRQRQRMGFTNFNMNDAFLEAAYARLDEEEPGAAHIRESRYEYDEEYAANLEVTGTIPNPVDPSVTFPTVVIPTTRRTAAEIAASIQGVSLGIPKPTAAEPEPKPTGTGPAPAEDGL